MLLSEIKDFLGADVLSDTYNPDCEISAVYASDLMSDVLAGCKDADLLLSGLNNIQTINTAVLADIPVVILVGNKPTRNEVIQMANKEGICLLSTKLNMYEVCGILFKNGLPSAGK